MWSEYLLMKSGFMYISAVAYLLRVDVFIFLRGEISMHAQKHIQSGYQQF